MDSEDELLCVLSALIITEEKNYEKEEKTQGIGSAEYGAWYLDNQMRSYNREQYFK